jgi:signal peptidase I
MKANSARTGITKRKSSGGVVDTIKTVVYAVLIALVVRTVAYEPFNIPSGSMVPTLLIGDYLFVSKFSYGYSRYSLPLGLPLFSGRILSHSPERGDVVVFKVPTDNSTDYIKRVIGLPGDRVQMRQGELYINGQLVPRRKVKDEQCQDDRLGVCVLYDEMLPNGATHRIIKSMSEGEFNNTKEYFVPEASYFMMGDNRDNSADSRIAFKSGLSRPYDVRTDDEIRYVPAENLIGRAQFIFFSANPELARLWEIWKWPFAIRYSRLFRAVE